MTTVHEIAALLPGPDRLRDHLRALAVLDAAINNDLQESQYVFDEAWGPGVEAAFMDNGSGDDFTVLFTPSGVLVRGFDHEAPMSPSLRDDEKVWPGVLDDVPTSLRPFLDEATVRVEGMDALRVTACLWRETGDTAWRTGSAIEFPADGEDPDGSGFLFELLVDRSAEAAQAHFEGYYEFSAPLDAIRHVLAGRPLTLEVTKALNPEPH